jgi:hypothetical protein
LHNPDSVVWLLNECGVKDTDTVYVISSVKELDGQMLPMWQAVEQVLNSDFGSVVCTLDGRLAYYRPEAPECGCILEMPA